MRPYYEEGAIVIYHGSCLDVLPLLSPVAHVITDPPYEAEAHTLQRRVKRNGGVMEREPLEFPALDSATRFLAAREVARLTERWVITFCQVEAAMSWRAAYEEYGLSYRRACVWVKPDGMPQYSGDRPGMGYETIVAMHKRGASRWNGGGRHGVFTHNKNDGAGAAPHPTTKPERLMAELVALFTDPGDLILDPFGGSGTTAVAAKRLGRRCILIECEEKYCEIAANRLRQSALDLWEPGTAAPAVVTGSGEVVPSVHARDLFTEPSSSEP